MEIKTLIAAVAVASVATGALAGHHMAGEGHSAKHGTADHAAAQADIVEIAAGNSDFSTLVTALEAADLAGVLQGDGPYTVFAPTNEAFAALPEGTVEMLLKPENKDKLIAVLTYHVVPDNLAIPGKVTATDVTKLSSAKTVQGDEIAISTHEGRVMINDAHVIVADISASNGVIHVIDAVILPSS